jgi:hypothetical protein
MIRIDISKMIPKHLGTYLLGILPGLFFEGSIAIGDPRFGASVVSRLREIYPFGPYALLLLFLTAGLFIGQGFWIAAGIVNLLIGFVFALWRSAIQNTFGSTWLYRYFGKLQGMPPKRTVFIRSLSRLIFWAREQAVFPTGVRPVMKCEYIAARHLLKARYGIDRKFSGPVDEGEWKVWNSVLGKPLPDYREASIVSRAILGCGLAGFTALYALPVLRERYFIALCALFTFAGLYTSVDLARWRFNPLRWVTAKLKSVLLEISETSNATVKATGDSAEVLNASADADGE